MNIILQKGTKHPSLFYLQRVIRLIGEISEISKGNLINLNCQSLIESEYMATRLFFPTIATSSLLICNRKSKDL